MSLEQSSVQSAVPTLTLGDRLTRSEFERRYEVMPNPNKAELVDGCVQIRSMAQWPLRANAVGRLISWSGYYVSFTPFLIGARNATIRIDGNSEVQPDATILVDPAQGGQSIVGADDFIERAPEWLAEVSGASSDLDLHTKLAVYRRNGVRECVVWRVLDQQIDWFSLRSGEFVPLKADGAGILCSEAFPGLWLDAPALIRGDMPRVLEVVQQGLASPEHAAFLRAHPLKS